MDWCRAACRRMRRIGCIRQFPRNGIILSSFRRENRGQPQTLALLACQVTGRAHTTGRPKSSATSGRPRPRTPRSPGSSARPRRRGSHGSRPTADRRFWLSLFRGTGRGGMRSTKKGDAAHSTASAADPCRGTGWHNYSTTQRSRAGRTSRSGRSRSAFGSLPGHTARPGLAIVPSSQPCRLRRTDGRAGWSCLGQPRPSAEPPSPGCCPFSSNPARPICGRHHPGHSEPRGNLHRRRAGVRAGRPECAVDRGTERVRRTWQTGRFRTSTRNVAIDDGNPTLWSPRPQ